MFLIFNIIATKTFSKQFSKLNEKSKRIIKTKIDIIRFNPFHYKRIHSKHFSKIFRVRLNAQGVETRLLYTVLGKNIILIGLLKRKHGYKDLDKYLKYLKD